MEGEDSGGRRRQWRGSIGQWRERTVGIERGEDDSGEDSGERDS